MPREVTWICTTIPKKVIQLYSIAQKSIHSQEGLPPNTRNSMRARKLGSQPFTDRKGAYR
ncbi:hypothetical protein RSAG8_06285, partial [Rhizoctonia solani AG-8 WAC10335]